MEEDAREKQIRKKEPPILSLIAQRHAMRGKRIEANKMGVLLFFPLPEIFKTDITVRFTKRLN